MPVAGDVVVEMQAKALAKYNTWALNYTHKTLSLVTDEIYQIGKVILQNHMSIDILTAAQGDTCAILHSKCCIYIPDHQHNISLALAGLSQEI